MFRSPLPALKQTNLTQAGFAPLRTDPPALFIALHQPVAYVPASEIRYEHSCQAQDGTRLYVYSWLDAPGYLLTTRPRITSLSHIITELDTDDPHALQGAVNDFFARHGGVLGLPVPGCN